MDAQNVIVDENAGKLDRYFTETLRVTWKMRREHVTTGTSIKLLASLGDGTAVALMKVLSTLELVQPDTIRGYLPLVEQSFATLKCVQIEENKTPRVTMFLLKSLEHFVDDIELRKEIQRVTKYVKQQTNYTEQ